MTELITELTSKLNIDQTQAQGALGSILGFAKDQLSETDFSKITSSIENSGDFMAKAPKTEGLGGMLGGITSALGVDTGNLGNLAQLAGQFKSLNLDSDMINKFLPILMNFLESKGGEEVKSIVSKLFQK